MLRGCGQAIAIIAEIDVRQIARQDFVLGQPRLQPEADQHFANLAPHRPVGVEKGVLGKLLRDRAAALGRSIGKAVMDRRAQNAARVDSPMAVKAAVFDGDECAGHALGQFRGIDRLADDRAALGDRRAVGGEQRDRRRGKRLQRFGKRRGQREPPDRDDQQDDAKPNPAPQPAPPAKPTSRRTIRGAIFVPICIAVIVRRGHPVGQFQRIVGIAAVRVQGVVAHHWANISARWQAGWRLCCEFDVPI